MTLKPRSLDKINQLIRKGVDIPNPLTMDIGEEVRVEQISPDGVKIYPGCRIYGEKTVIAAGARIGYEGPATIENCQVGPGVELKGGFFKDSVFLEGACMGLGAHVREGCLIEEQASGAHCVALKQTILFPFVTLGGLINFCDCLMAGGRSRQDHSEVGSSFIHFNFTPEGDKTTASLVGDVPKGVMLNQARIFLGGQGGMVGPVRIGYGNVVAAGTILRHDSLEENKLILGKSYREVVTAHTPYLYSGLSRIVENNILYLANLVALEQWYLHVRRSFFEEQEYGNLIYAGVLNKLSLAKTERLKRLKALADKMPLSLERHPRDRKAAVRKKELLDKIRNISQLFYEESEHRTVVKWREGFLTKLERHRASQGGGYLEIVKSLPESVSEEGTRWLQRVIDDLCQRASEIMPSMALFKK
ncbi:MAG: protein GlmU [Desulfobacterales bacterium]|nr:protein GlmU [Desulfobacterales bacterium]